MDVLITERLTWMIIIYFYGFVNFNLIWYFSWICTCVNFLQVFGPIRFFFFLFLLFINSLEDLSLCFQSNLCSKILCLWILEYAWTLKDFHKFINWIHMRNFIKNDHCVYTPLSFDLLGYSYVLLPQHIPISPDFI